jgi:hypothetical protein
MIRPRDNPFAMDRLEAVLAFRPEWSGTTWPGLLDRVTRARGKLAVTGHHGAGKTTFLDALAPRLEARGHPVARLFFNDMRRTFEPAALALPDAAARTIILIDGDTHLPMPGRLRLHRHISAFRLSILARHRPSRHPTLLHLAPTAGTLHHCVRTAAPDAYPRLAPHLDHWFTLDRHNIRLTLRRCYDAIQDWCGSGIMS